jgi:hypothetical protein
MGEGRIGGMREGGAGDMYRLDIIYLHRLNNDYMYINMNVYSRYTAPQNVCICI